MKLKKIHTWRNKNRYLWIFVAIFLSGYVFFFSSSYWYPGGNGKVTPSRIGVAYSKDEHAFTLLSWEYSEKQRLMELQIDVKDQSLDGNADYEISALDRKKGRMRVDEVVKKDDYIVIRLHPEARWSEIAVHIGVPGSSDTMKFYANKKSVSKVDEIADRSEKELYLAKYQKNIAQCESQISDLEQEKEQCQDQIQKYENRKIELNASKEYQTTEEIRDTDELITKTEGQISDLKTQISSIEDAEKEMQEKIQKLQEQMKQYQ